MKLSPLFIAAWCSVVGAQIPETEGIPPTIAQAALQPDAVLDEKQEPWRDELKAIFQPLVQDCKSTREAVLAIASQMTQATGVYYSTQRRHPSMNAQEALREKKVSCTGQSILLACALRSVGIPARAVGVASWGHMRGNHTWCEAWFDGGWHMIEFNERDFNTPWVMEYVGMLNPKHPRQRIYAASPGARDGFFPIVWNPWCHIEAEDVTERYLELARAWYEKAGLPADSQRLMLDIHPRPAQARMIYLEDAEENRIAEATLPTQNDDMRRTAVLNLPRTGSYYLRVQGSTQRQPVQAGAAPVQVLHLQTVPNASE